MLAELTPAQLTSMSTWPRSCSVSAKQAIDRGAIRDVHRQIRRLAAELFDRRDAVATMLFVAAGDDDKRAGLRDTIAERAAEHARAADDDGRLAGEAEQFFEVILDTLNLLGLLVTQERGQAPRRHLHF